jgi:hypothetical protein
MNHIDIALYGTLARFGGGTHVAKLQVKLPEDAQMSDLYAQLGIPLEEKGYCFINAVLCDAPGLSASLSQPLKDGDHVGIFSITHMWPYQYRDGVRMTDALAKAMKAHGTMRNTYT